jgi:hypothetical protein
MIAASLAAATSFLATAAAGAAAAPPAGQTAVPHIVAKPSNLMVNTTTRLTGTGFRPNATLTVMECSRTGWIVPQEPCATKNAVTVTTSSVGTFHASMTALVCPKVMQPAGSGFQETCYVGVPHPRGIDTIVLVGAAKIIVTGP